MSEMMNKNEGESKSTLFKDDASRSTSLNEAAPKKSTLFKDDAPKKSTLFKSEMSKDTSGGAAVKKASRKNIFLFAALGALLAILVITLVLLSIFKPSLGGDKPKFDVWEGEDVFGNAAHLVYPLIDEHTVTKMDVYKDGEQYSFIQFWDEDVGKYDWRIEGIEKMDLDASAFEMLRMWMCTLTTKTPIRNVDDENLSTYGVDMPKENGFTLYYEENGEEKSHTVRIGDKTSLSSGEYYAYYEGRGHVYKISSDVITYTSYDKVKYLSPVINTFFENEMTVLYGIEHFKIHLTNGSNTKLNHLLSIEISEKGDGDKGESNIEFKTIYSALALGKERTTISSTSYVNSVFTTLYTAFSGSEVVAINPTDEELTKFGLSSSQEKYFLEVEFSSDAKFANAKYKDKDPDLYISRKIDESYYVMSEYYGMKSVVRVDASKLPFLGESSFLLLKWTDTTSVKTSFFETLTQTDSAPGLDKIFVWTPKSEDVFELSYDASIDELTAYAKNANLTFKDDNTQGNSFDRNRFRVLYIYMLYFPFIYSFNDMELEETESYVTDENLVYSITAHRNDETVIKYSYYSISGSLAVEKIEEGELKNGEAVFENARYENIVEKEQIRRVTLAIDKLLAGEELLPDEDILK